jgi:hypothetical protein
MSIDGETPSKKNMKIEKRSLTNFVCSQTGICTELTLAEGGYNCSCKTGFAKEDGSNDTKSESPCVGKRLRLESHSYAVLS